MKRAILLQTGLPFPPWATPSPGIHKLAEKLARIYPDRNDTWLAVRDHDYHLQSDADAIAAANPQFIIHVSHSFVAGHGLKYFGENMERVGRRITLACLVDPVEDVWFTNIKRERPYPLPENIDAAVAYRTLNQSSWFMPWGRRCEGLNVIVMFQFPETSSYNHGTVDSAPEFHDAVIRAIQALG